MTWLEEHRTFAAIVIAVVLVLVLSVLSERFLRSQERRLEATYRGDFASAKTRFRLIRRIIVAVVVLIGVLAALAAFAPDLGRALLASSAVAAIVAGFALRTPLANVVAGMQLALTQPFRLGDRIRVGTETGVVDEIKLSYTVLRTDDGRRAFLPNEQLIASPIVNATIEDPIRAETVRIPVSLDADLGAVLVAMREVVHAVEGPVDDPPATVRVDDVTTGAVVLAMTIWVADGDAAVRVGAATREQAVGRLRELGALARG